MAGQPALHQVLLPGDHHQFHYQVVDIDIDADEGDDWGQYEDRGAPINRADPNIMQQRMEELANTLGNLGNVVQNFGNVQMAGKHAAGPIRIILNCN